MSNDRRFPRPWSFELLEESVIIRDATGCKLMYMYHGETERERDVGRLTTREAIVLAKGIVKRINAGAEGQDT